MKRKVYPKYKPSGVEWLGEVPEHWEVKRSRFVFSMNPSKQEIALLPEDTEVSFLPMEAVGENGSLDLERTRPIIEVGSGYTYFAENDVTFAKITPCFENGKGAIMRNLVGKCGFGTTELTVLRPSEYANSHFMYYLTISGEFRKNGEAWMYGAGGQKRVPDEFVKEFRFCWPQLSEQQSIASFLDRETAKLDSLITKVKSAIEKLKEYRTALISAAVTGKICVKEEIGRMKDE
jgi:type I restriction enzyme, S subunit